MWLILWGLWAAFGLRLVNARTGGGTRRRVATGRAEARPQSCPLSNVGRLPLLLKRSEAADYLAEHLSQGDGTSSHFGNASRRSSFLFPFKRLYFIFTKQSRIKHVFNNFKNPWQSIYITYTPAEFIIYYTSVLLLYYLTRTPPPARASFFLFSFFYYSFSSFIFSFFFSFMFLFFSFVFSLFVFSFSFFSFFFFSQPAFLQALRRRQGVSLYPLTPSRSPLLRFHNIRPIGVKENIIKNKERAKV